MSARRAPGHRDGAGGRRERGRETGAPEPPPEPPAPRTATEDMLSLIFEAIPENMFLVEVLDDGGVRMLAVNGAFERSYGVTRERLVGHTLDEVLPRGVHAALAADLTECVKSGETVSTRRTLDASSGSRVFDGTLVPLRNAAGRVDRVVGISRDVTERDAAERARAAAEQRYRDLVDNAADAMFVVDTSYRYIDVNVAACRLLGYTRDELLNLTIPDVTPPELNPRQEERLQKMDTGETLFSERVLRRKDGTLVDVELSARGLHGAGLAIVRDITERKRAAREQARLAAAVEQADEAIVITDPKATILYVNPAFERVSGYGRDELVGQNPRILHSGQHDRAFYEAMWRTLKAGQTWRGTFVNLRKDGSIFEEDSVISPIFDSGGEVVSYVGVKRDVTRERALEAQLRQAQKIEAVGQLAGGIAHDFNNLITAIRGYSELIAAGLPSAPDRADIDQIILAADRAAELTRQLLAFTRQQVLQPHVLAPAVVVTDLAAMLRRLLGEHIELKTSAAPDAGCVRVDPSQLEQVIVNLSVNARDAMPDGGRLTIETANVVFDTAGAASHGELPPGAYVRIRVADNGTGMDAATRARAFEPFFTTKATGKGTGMGLATVYGIVRQSGGYVYLYSELGRGTTVELYLPRVAADRPPPAAPDSSEVPTGSETVLLVEDEPAVRSFARRVLQELGYIVIEAVDGADAVSVVNESAAGPIDLLLTDVVMPRVGGQALAERLRGMLPGLRVLLMSGFAEHGAGEELAIEPGSFIPKPFTREELARAVRRALQG